MARGSAPVLVALLPLCASAQSPVLQGNAAFGDWQSDKPGVRRHITARDLPAVSASTSASPAVAPMPQGASPRVPDGFEVEVVATGLRNPRAMRVAPNADLFVADSAADQVRVYRTTPGKPATHEVFATGLHRPYGIAFYPAGADPKWIYVGNSDSVVRFPYTSGDMKASGKPETIVPRLPSTGGHWTRDLLFTADGSRLLIAVGSESNVDERNSPEAEHLRADVLSVDPEGKDLKVFASGLRNCSGLAMNPVTREPWCVVNERDGLGDNTPFDYATQVREGAFYGWPWYYLGANQDPRHKGEHPELKDKVTVPDVLFQAHSAPLQITFYGASAFPAEYRGGAFATMHGSWNRAHRTGYKVVYLPFGKDGKPTGEYVDFMTGFVTPEGKVWGRPVGVAVAGDGSLFVSDDGSRTIWRITRR